MSLNIRKIVTSWSVISFLIFTTALTFLSVKVIQAQTIREFLEFFSVAIIVIVKEYASPLAVFSIILGALITISFEILRRR